MLAALSIVGGREVEELQDELLQVARSAQKLDTRPFELVPFPRLCDELLPAVTTTMDSAIEVLERVLSRYDAPTAVEGPESSGMFDACFEALVEPAPAPSPPSVGQRVADASFMARWELHRKRGAVQRAAERDDARGLLSECCSGRRRVLKATSGVERLLSQVERRPSVFEGLYRTERKLAVDTRAAYFTFVSRLPAEVLEGAALEGRPLERCVRLAGTDIAKLMGRDVYQDLRVEDRLEIRALQRRLLAWLLGPRDEQDGRRVLSDLSAFASLLMEVNRRPVLVEHDRELLERLQAALHGGAMDEAALRGELPMLRGRDPELDDLIALRAELRPELWDATVSRVLAALAQQDPRATAHDDEGGA